MTKVFKDPIHGTIELDENLVKIIDTPEFQRLRFIKQLGGCYFVFPGASHNRFEHSIGVSHLAGQLVRHLRQNQPDLKISDNDVMCVEIAGLCHDLGHGPFSHLFDAFVIPELRKGCGWKHEKGSIDMLKHLHQKNEHIKDMLTDKDITFIGEMINGPEDGQPYKGTNKTFLYEIVSNALTGVDVDKWDYFARDSHHLGITGGFDHSRYIKFLRVLDVDEDGKKVKHICPREKEAGSLYDMFHTRYMLHSRAYQHKVNKIIEIMIKDALVQADEHLRFPKDDGTEVKLSETIDHMDAYVHVTDNVFEKILHSTDPKLKKAKEILQRIERREIYQWLGKIKPTKEEEKRKETLGKEIYRYCPPGQEKHGLTKDEIRTFPVKLDYGKKEKDPLENLWVWKKEEPDKAEKLKNDEISAIIPRTYQDTILHVFCTSNKKEAVDVAKMCFNAWIKDREIKDKKKSHTNNIRSCLLWIRDQLRQK